MTVYNLKVAAHEPIYSDDYLDGYVSLAKDDAFHTLEKKLFESGVADEGFDSVEGWFNDNCDVDKDYSFAREFYNSTIGHSDIEVTFDRDYYVDLDGDTFVAHVDDTWDELGKNAEAIRLLKENAKLGQKYLDMYISGYASKEFKQVFESIIKDDYAKTFDVEPELPQDKFELKNFQSNIEFLISESDINWKTESILDGLYSDSLNQHIEFIKRKNRVQYKQIEYFMKSLLEELPKSEQSKVEKQIYYDTRKNSLQFMLTVNGSSPHFFVYYDKNKGAKSDTGAAQCWIKDGYLNGCVYHDGNFEPFDEHYQAEKFVGSLESLVDSLVDTDSLTELPKQ